VITALLAILFLMMIAAPCVIALRSSPKNDGEELEAEDISKETMTPVFVAAAEQSRPAPRRAAISLQELAAEAEHEAIVAEEFARKAHWAALDAAAHAAALRADVAAEVAELAGRVAEEAIRAAEAEFGEDFLYQMHPSFEDPRSRGRRRAA